MLDFELVTETRLAQWMAEEFGERAIPARMWRAAAVTVLARLSQEHHLAIAVDASERLFPALDQVLRARVTAPVAQRAGNLMLDHAWKNRKPWRDCAPWMRTASACARRGPAKRRSIPAFSISR